MNSNSDKSERREHESVRASGWTVSGGGHEAVQHEREARTSAPVATSVSSSPLDDANAQRSEMTNLQLVLFGVFGGLYLLYSIGWFFIAQYFAAANSLAAASSGIIGGVFQQVLFWSSAAAPALWFVASVLLARGRRAWFLPVAFLVGIVVLLPLPLFVVGESQ